MKDNMDLLDGLNRAPKVLTAFVSTISEEKMDRRRGDDFWTIAEHVSHLAQVQPMLMERIRRFLDEDRPEFVPYIPGEEEQEPDRPDI